MRLETFGLTQHAGTENSRFVTSGAVDELTVLDWTGRVQLEGLYLAGVIVAEANEGPAHVVTVTAHGPDNRLITGFQLPVDLSIRLDPQESGQSVGAFWLPLDGFSLANVGVYTWTLAVNGEPLEPTARLTVKHDPRLVRVAFSAFVQDQQGNEAGEKYMAGRLLMTVITHGRSAAGVQVRVKQPMGEDFAHGGFEVVVPPEYSDFLAAPEFRAAVDTYARDSALSVGGTLDGAGSVTMRNNLIVSDPSFNAAQFRLPEPSDGAW